MGVTERSAGTKHGAERFSPSLYVYITFRCCMGRLACMGNEKSDLTTITLFQMPAELKKKFISIKKT